MPRCPGSVDAPRARTGSCVAVRFVTPRGVFCLRLLPRIQPPFPTGFWPTHSFLSFFLFLSFFFSCPSLRPAQRSAPSVGRGSQANRLARPGPPLPNPREDVDGFDQIFDCGLVNTISFPPADWFAHVPCQSEYQRTSKTRTGRRAKRQQLHKDPSQPPHPVFPRYI